MPKIFDDALGREVEISEEEYKAILELTGDSFGIQRIETLPDGSEITTDVYGNVAAAQDGIDRTVTLFMDEETLQAIGPLAGSAFADEGQDAVTGPDDRNYVMTLEKTDECLYYELENSKNKVTFRGYGRDVQHTHAHCVNEFSWPLDHNGHTYLTLEKMQNGDAYGIFVIVLRFIRYVLEQDGTLAELKDPTQPKAGVVFRVNRDGAVTYDVVRGSDRPDLPVHGVLGDEWMARPYPDEMFGTKPTASPAPAAKAETAPECAEASDKSPSPTLETNNEPEENNSGSSPKTGSEPIDKNTGSALETKSAPEEVNSNPSPETNSEPEVNRPGKIEAEKEPEEKYQAALQQEKSESVGSTISGGKRSHKKVLPWVIMCLILAAGIAAGAVMLNKTPAANTPAAETAGMTEAYAVEPTPEPELSPSPAPVDDTPISVADLDEYKALYDARPDGNYLFEFELFGQTVTQATETLQYENEDIGDEGLEQFRSMLPYLPNLTYLSFDGCGTTSEACAALRDDFPDKTIAWRVKFGSYSYMTDTEKINAVAGLNDSNITELKYCTAVKYMDLQYNTFTNIDFVSDMPKLEVLVLRCCNKLSDISALACCPELEYLELTVTSVNDISVLAGCEKLKHLEISQLFQLTDITPLYNLDLERMHAMSDSKIPAEQKEEFQRLHPNCDTNFNQTDDPLFSGGNWLTGERYELLKEQLSEN